MKKEEVNTVEIVDYEIIKAFKDNPLVRSILYTEKLYHFMLKKDLGLLPTKIINVILSAVKEEQQQFIKNKDELTGDEKQLSFDDVFKGWNENTRALFTISFKSIKLDKNIKNKELYNAFIALSNLHWEIYTDDATDVSELVPFIEGVKWTGISKSKKVDENNKLIDDRRDRHIQFRMHRRTMESLLDMSRFLKLENTFVMNLKSPKTLTFIFWLSKHIPNGGVTIGVKKFCEELGFTYTYDSKVFEYLNRIRAEMNQSYAYSINYGDKIENGLLKIRIYDTKKGIGETKGIDSLEDLQIKRALYHIKKTRNLNDEQFNKVQKIYKIIGYEKVSKLIKRRIEKEITGNEYLSRLQDLIDGKE